MNEGSLRGSENPTPRRQDPPHDSPGSTLRHLRWPLTILGIALVVLFGYLWTVRTTGEAVHDTLGQVGKIADRFRTGTITETFVAAIPEIKSIRGGNLEVATAHIVESFKRSDEQRILWDWVSLGETVTEIKVPVTFRYHVRLNDRWQLEVDRQTCIVRAPKLRASLPPAIHTDGMERRVDRGWLRFDSEEQLDDLQKSITRTLSSYADDPRHLDLVRDKARRSVAEFVRSWLLNEAQWGKDRFRMIVVLFPEEYDNDPGEIGPALSLEDPAERDSKSRNDR